MADDTTGQKGLVRVLDGAQAQIASVADRGTDLGRLLTLVRAVMASSPDLAEVLTTREGLISVATATTRLAELGLEPTGRTGGAYLVAYRSNVAKRDAQPIWRKFVQVIPDWRAYLRWAVREKLADDVIARPVHEGDEFAMDIDPATGAETVTHRYDPFGERGPRRGWYVGLLRDGRRPMYEFMGMAEIAKRRAISRTDKVWTQWPEEMERKTVVRWAIDRRLPLGAAKLSALMAADDETVDLDAQARPATPLAALPQGRRVRLTGRKAATPEPAPEPAAEEPATGEVPDWNPEDGAPLTADTRRLVEEALDHAPRAMLDAMNAALDDEGLDATAMDPWGEEDGQRALAVINGVLAGEART